jgi:hypothetical protein
MKSSDLFWGILKAHEPVLAISQYRYMHCFFLVFQHAYQLTINTPLLSFLTPNPRKIDLKPSSHLPTSNLNQNPWFQPPIFKIQGFLTSKSQVSCIWWIKGEFYVLILTPRGLPTFFSLSSWLFVDLCLPLMFLGFICSRSCTQARVRLVFEGFKLLALGRPRVLFKTHFGRIFSLTLHVLWWLSVI